MGVREEVLQMLKEGLSPKDISRQRNVTLSTTLGYVDQLIGQGCIRRSDVLFSVPTDIRNTIMSQLTDGCYTSFHDVMRKLQLSGVIVENDDITTVARYSGTGYALGEMYEDIRTIEVGLHNLIRETLENEFGSEECGWWRRGVPVEIRKKCQERREEDDSDTTLEPYCYTDLIDLKEILNKQWSILCRNLPKQMANDKKGILDDLTRLNQIRRLVMHPVRGGRPSEEDFEFIRGLKDRLGFV